MADLVLLRSFPHAALARLAAHHLESHGVSAYLDGDSAIGAIGVDAVSVRLLVTRDDAVRARALLERGTLDDDDDASGAREDDADLDEPAGHARPSSPAAAGASPRTTSGARPLAAALAITGLGLGVALVALVHARREIAVLEAASARCDVDTRAPVLETTRAFVAPVEVRP